MSCANVEVAPARDGRRADRNHGRRVTSLALEAEAIHGVRWTFLAYATSRVVGLVSTLILARLLVPRDFGLLALAAVLLEVGTYLTTFGLESALVIRLDITGDALGTALVLLVATNMATAVVVACLAPAASAFLGDPKTVPVVLALAAPLLIGGVTSFYDALLRRELLFRPLFIARAVQSLLSVLVSLVLAFAGWGVWSLVLGRVTADVSFPLVLAALAPYHARPRWDTRVARSLARSGRGFIIQSTFSFIEQNSDYAVVSRLLGSQALGVYSMGFRVGELPYESIVQPVAQATFPGFARLQEKGDDPTQSFLALLRLTALCVLPLGMVIAGAADPAVRALLGPKWSGVIAVLPLLGFWGSARALWGTMGWFVSSLGHATRLGASYAALVTLSIPAMVVSVEHLGIEGAALVMSGNALLALGIGLSITTRQIGLAWRRQWVAVRPAVVAAVPTFLVAAAISSSLHHAVPELALGAAAAGALLVYIVVVSIQDPDAIPYTARQLRRVAGGSRRERSEPAPADTPGAAPADAKPG
jgi:O-antigen/teichoic acid export membrane protein